MPSLSRQKIIIRCCPQIGRYNVIVLVNTLIFLGLFTLIFNFTPIEASLAFRPYDAIIQLSNQAHLRHLPESRRYFSESTSSILPSPRQTVESNIQNSSETDVYPQPIGPTNFVIHRNDKDSIEDSLCTLGATSRRSLIAARLNQDVIERTLKCSRIGETNYRQMVKSIYKRDELDIQQCEISDSEPSVVFSALDLICGRFNCSRLTVLNISGQAIQDYNVLGSWIVSWSNLEVLDLSNTCLSSIESIFKIDIGPSIILESLTSLYLNNNNITDLNLDFILERMPNLRHLSLVNNSIFNINCSESLRPHLRAQLDSISLAGNAINCDKSQLWFIKQFQATSSPTSLKFPEYEQIKCGSSERFAEMTWSQRVSVLETKICDDCECKSMKKTAISVDCHNKNLTVLPDVLPLNTKILNLTSNRISSLGVPQNSKNWENVTYVYLENNLISSFQPLGTNSKFMKNLAALDIRRNKFREFPSHIFEQFTNLDQVHLSNNPWLCDCEPTFTFQEWLQRQFHKVGDKEEIKCGISGNDENGVRSCSFQQRLSARVIYRLSKSELCPQDNFEEPYDWLDIVNVVLGITIVLILFKVTLDYIYQHRTERLPHFFKLNL